jgi:hypothetical protein
MKPLEPMKPLELIEPPHQTQKNAPLLTGRFIYSISKNLFVASTAIKIEQHRETHGV